MRFADRPAACGASRFYFVASFFGAIQVARASVLAFNPDAKIKAYHSNIKDRQFDVEYLSQFNLVMNALDNLDARR